MIKPDGVARGLTEEILDRITKAGLKIIQTKQLSVTPEMAADLYAPHFGKNFYPGLLNFIISGPVLACQLQGEEAINHLRQIMGATDPRQAQAGTIRGDLKEENIFTADGSIKNLIHGSDSPEAAKRESVIFFDK
ncbi:nucleoside-diphosphate kinase [Candidatus Saganbacteria bacterium]|nr:nucleoside-diphosphate kinase [Candidatus Saganbacteria bacterium]